MTTIDPSSELRARVLASARAEKSPTRDDVKKRVLLVTAVALVGAGAMFLVLGGVVLGERPGSFVLHAGLAWGFLVAVSGALLMRRGGHGLGSPAAVLAIGAASIAPALALVYVLLTRLEDAGALRQPTMMSHLVCFSLSIVFAAAPLSILVAARRGADPVHPRAFGALGGAVAGGFGGLVLTMHCPIATEGHVMLAHAAPALALAVIGSAIGARLFGPRA